MLNLNQPLTKSTAVEPVWKVRIQLIMHLSLAFPGIEPRNTPGDLFSGSNKNILNPWGIGHKIHTNFPSPEAKLKAKYLYFQ